jgi:hypothetical protein
LGAVCAGLLAVCGLLLSAGPLARGAGAQTVGVSGSKVGVSATLEECLTAPVQAERAATFAGEMAAIPGSARMEMRIDVLERMPGEMLYHAVSAPGLGVWRSSAPGVKVYRYLKQVTNLSGPAFYRGAVRFRWLSARGRLISTIELRTRRCEQPAATSTTPPPSATPTSSLAG